MRHSFIQIFAGAFFLLLATGCGSNSPSEISEERQEIASTPSLSSGFTPAAICIVPDVVGLEQTAAENSLNILGLQPVRSVEHNDLFAVNAVTAQNPPAGTELEPCQGRVTITVSLGALPTPVNTPLPPTATATATTSPTSTPIPPTATITPRPSGPIPFSLPGNPNQLNPAFTWHQGGSNASSYDLTLNPGYLTLIAGPNTQEWEGAVSAPLVAYPFTGDFEASVKTISNPTGRQHTRFCVRAATDHNARLCIAEYGSTITIWTRDIWIDERVSFSGDIAYLKIERKGSLFTLSYGTTGSNWIVVKENYVFDLTPNVEIYIGVAAPANEGLVAQFSDFVVIGR